MLLFGIMRAIIDLPDEQAAQLQEICERADISRAEAVRRAISLYTAQQAAEQRTLGLQALVPAFGLWAKDGRKTTDGVAYQQALRADWD